MALSDKKSQVRVHNMAISADAVMHLISSSSASSQSLSDCSQHVTWNRIGARPRDQLRPVDTPCGSRGAEPERVGQQRKLSTSSSQ